MEQSMTIVTHQINQDIKNSLPVHREPFEKSIRNIYIQVQNIDFDQINYTILKKIVILFENNSMLELFKCKKKTTQTLFFFAAFSSQETEPCYSDFILFHFFRLFALHKDLLENNLRQTLQTISSVFCPFHALAQQSPSFEEKDFYVCRPSEIPFTAQEARSLFKWARKKFFNPYSLSTSTFLTQKKKSLCQVCCEEKLMFVIPCPTGCQMKDLCLHCFQRNSNTCLYCKLPFQFTIL